MKAFTVEKLNGGILVCPFGAYRTIFTPAFMFSGIITYKKYFISPNTDHNTLHE
jgi:hypothetical protein